MVSKLKTTVEWIDLFCVPAVCQNLRRSRPSSIASDSRPISQYGFCIHKVRRALTSGPQDNPTKAVNVGMAVHIMAASAGGPRYDVTLSPEQRSAPSNGCQNCAKLIDNDRFSLELLTRWRADAETEARSRVGK